VTRPKNLRQNAMPKKFETRAGRRRRTRTRATTRPRCCPSSSLSGRSSRSSFACASYKSSSTFFSGFWYPELVTNIRWRFFSSVCECAILNCQFITVLLVLFFRVLTKEITLIWNYFCQHSPRYAASIFVPLWNPYDLSQHSFRHGAYWLFKNVL